MNAVETQELLISFIKQNEYIERVSTIEHIFPNIKTCKDIFHHLIYYTKSVNDMIDNIMICKHNNKLLVRLFIKRFGFRIFSFPNVFVIDNNNKWKQIMMRNNINKNIIKETEQKLALCDW